MVQEFELRILVVDDNVDAVSMLSILLKHMGYHVMTAYDGEVALRVAAEFEPHLVLMDIIMPRMNGFTTCQHMRSTDRDRNMRIVALTGRSQKEDIEQAYHVGFDEFLLKPVGRDQLAMVISDCIPAHSRS